MDDQTPRQPRQRWQILFSRTEPALSLRQEQLTAAFEQAFREAELPLSVTPGKRPRARVSLAASLPAGIEADEEVLEAYFDELLPVERVITAGALLPEGLRILDARDVWQGFPSAASQVRAAEYVVRVEPSGDELISEASLREGAARVLAAGRLPGKRGRGETERRADVGERDLRPHIEEIEVTSVADDGRSAEMTMVLRAGPTGAARPGDVVAAMELPVRAARIARRRLRFVDTAGARPVE